MIEFVVFGVGILVSGMVAAALVQIGEIEKDLAAQAEARAAKSQETAPAPATASPEQVPKRAA